MNSDSEAINQFLAWLLQDSSFPVTAPSGDLNQSLEPDFLGTANPTKQHLDPLDFEDVTEFAADFSESNYFSFEEIPLLEPGDISTVQDRFYTLLKRRLQAEIERKPPLFPWESAVYEYDADVPEWESTPAASTNPWMLQLQNLSLSVLLPDAVLTSLLTQCQGLVQSSLREGQKLVQAVEALFPDQGQSLNQLAGLVLTSPSRSGSTVLPNTIEQYETASEPQQMALSLLAAQEILNSLTLTVSPNQAQLTRQWLTTAGPMQVQASMLDSGHLRIDAELPCSGRLQLKGEEAQAIAERNTPGMVSVELSDLPLNQIYPLEVRLLDHQDVPLIFAVRPTDTTTAN